MTSIKAYTKTPFPGKASSPESSARSNATPTIGGGNVIRHDIYPDNDSDKSFYPEDAFKLQRVPIGKKRCRAERTDEIDSDDLIQIGESASSPPRQSDPILQAPRSKEDTRPAKRTCNLARPTEILLSVAYHVVFAGFELSWRSIKRLRNTFTEPSSIGPADTDNISELSREPGNEDIPELAPNGSILMCGCLCCSPAYIQIVRPAPEGIPGYTIPQVRPLPAMFHGRILAMIAESPKIRIEEIVRTIHRGVPISAIRDMITPWGVFEFLRTNNDQDVLRNTPPRQRGNALNTSGLLHHLWYHSDLSFWAILRTLQTRHSLPCLSEKQLLVCLQKIGVTSGTALWDNEVFQDAKRLDKFGALRALNNGWINGMADATLLQYVYEMGYYHWTMADVKIGGAVCQAIFGRDEPLEQLQDVIRARLRKIGITKR